MPYYLNLKKIRYQNTQTAPGASKYDIVGRYTVPRDYTMIRFRRRVANLLSTSEENVTIYFLNGDGALLQTDIADAANLVDRYWSTPYEHLLNAEGGPVFVIKHLLKPSPVRRQTLL